MSVAKIGRSFGFEGDVVLHILSDFPESFRVGNVYHSQFKELTLERYSPQKSIAKFKEINSKEEAKQIVNCILYSTQEESRAQCVLEDNAFFWFDIIGSEVVENGEVLGLVSEIDRFCNQDYLYVKTSSALVAQNFSKSFLIPYNARYILKVESKIDSKEQNPKKDLLINPQVDFKRQSKSNAPKIIHTQFCKDILENS
ncbi:ribosome maturation factor RimM [Helicobacter sp. Faydin-H64]|uniref:Ribosome maturation factor RimM n=1 Tax=Helicobacter turcicus TaxID=2867412 RepID=A0ABS7JP57_9HELI|nr:ribosome maturation factor RimM [Helicobacter turcicus]MBX7546040.1 ribosome maturation factor RimM [Helicobacter turcicus]